MDNKLRFIRTNFRLICIADIVNVECGALEDRIEGDDSSYWEWRDKTVDINVRGYTGGSDEVPATIIFNDKDGAVAAYNAIAEFIENPDGGTVLKLQQFGLAEHPEQDGIPRGAAQMAGKSELNIG